MKKITAIMLICVLFATLSLSGCKGNDENTATEPTVTEAIEDFEGELGDLVAVAGDYHITMDEVNVYIGALVPYIQQSTGNSEGWEEILGDDGLTARDALIQYAIEEARYQHVFLNMAREDGYYTEEEDEAFYEEYIASLGTEEDYKAFLDEYGFTDEAFRKFISATGAYSVVQEKICPEDKAIEIYNSDYLTAKHVLVLFQGRDSEEAAYNEAKEVYEKAISGVSFEELVAAYNEDPGSQDPESSYTFVEGEMVDEFYEGTLNLKIGEISEPIKTVYGYHVIKRYPNPEKGTDLYENYIGGIISSALTKYVSEEKMTALMENYPITVNNKKLSEIDLSMYTAKEAVAE